MSIFNGIRVINGLLSDPQIKSGLKISSNTTIPGNYGFKLSTSGEHGLLSFGEHGLLLGSYLFGIRMFAQRTYNHGLETVRYTDYGDYVVYTGSSADTYNTTYPVLLYNNYKNNTKHGLQWSYISMNLYQDGYRMYGEASNQNVHDQSYFLNIINQILYPFEPLSGVFVRTGSTPLTNISSPGAKIKRYSTGKLFFRAVQIDIIGSNDSGTLYVYDENGLFEFSKDPPDDPSWGPTASILYTSGNKHASFICRLSPSANAGYNTGSIIITGSFNGDEFHWQLLAYGLKT